MDDMLVSGDMEGLLTCGDLLECADTGGMPEYGDIPPAMLKLGDRGRKLDRCVPSFDNRRDKQRHSSRVDSSSDAISQVRQANFASSTGGYLRDQDPDFSSNAKQTSPGPTAELLSPLTDRSANAKMSLQGPSVMDRILSRVSRKKPGCQRLGKDSGMKPDERSSVLQKQENKKEERKQEPCNIGVVENKEEMGGALPKKISLQRSQKKAEKVEAPEETTSMRGEAATDCWETITDPPQTEEMREERDAEKTKEENEQKAREATSLWITQELAKQKSPYSSKSETEKSATNTEDDDIAEKMARVMEKFKRHTGRAIARFHLFFVTLYLL